MREVLNVPDVSCGHCKAAIEGALQPLEGVRNAEVDLTAKSVTVDFDDGTIDRHAVVGAIEDAGYSVAR